MNTPNGTPFICRVCGADTFTECFTCEVVEDVRLEDPRNPIFVEKCQPMIGYECDTCSTMFSDPDKFTKKGN